eukprot:TRINITY_DN47081_c0_g1_i1.p1 TRINITY_DN47081_c0_g1~~TRINITY_DN47081_c0_g1_i1.p1  ORF type:complete len:168 (-),score=37.25 TRINITY_DN47081_c0_g1_i1:71-574(-)
MAAPSPTSTQKPAFARELRHPAASSKDAAEDKRRSGSRSRSWWTLLMHPVPVVTPLLFTLLIDYKRRRSSTSIDGAGDEQSQSLTDRLFGVVNLFQTFVSIVFVVGLPIALLLRVFMGEALDFGHALLWGCGVGLACVSAFAAANAGRVKLLIADALSGATAQDVSR